MCSVSGGGWCFWKNKQTKTPFPSFWSYHKRGSLLLWAGQGTDGRSWTTVATAATMTGASWGPSQHTEASAEEQAVLKELHRKGAEALMTSWTSGTSHTRSQSDAHLNFSLAWVNNSVFCLRQFVLSSCLFATKRVLTDTVPEQSLKSTNFEPHSLPFLKPSPTGHCLSPQAPRALPLSKGLHSDTQPRPTLTPEVSKHPTSPSPFLLLLLFTSQIQIHKAKIKKTTSISMSMLQQSLKRDSKCVCVYIHLYRATSMRGADRNKFCVQSWGRWRIMPAPQWDPTEGCRPKVQKRALQGTLEHAGHRKCYSSAQGTECETELRTSGTQLVQRGWGAWCCVPPSSFCLRSSILVGRKQCCHRQSDCRRRSLPQRLSQQTSMRDRAVSTTGLTEIMDNILGGRCWSPIYLQAGKVNKWNGDY